MAMKATSIAAEYLNDNNAEGNAYSSPNPTATAATKKTGAFEDVRVVGRGLQHS